MRTCLNTYSISVLITLSIVIFQNSSAIAQINVGVQVGMIRTNIEGDNQKNAFGAWFTPYVSQHVGLIFDFPIKEDMYISFQPGYKWSGSNMQVENSLNNIIDQLPDDLPEEIPKDLFEPWVDYGELRMQYLSLPLLLKLISDNKRWQFVVGAEVDVLTSASMFIIETGLTDNPSDGMNKVNLYAMIGFGYRFDLFKNRFSIDISYAQGLNNITTETGVDPNFNSRIKISTSEMRFAWYIPFHKPETIKKK